MNSLIRIMQRRKYDLTNVAASSSLAAVTVAERIDISMATELELIIRCHRNNLGLGSTIFVNLVPDLFDSMDPGNIFLLSGTNIATSQISNGTAAPGGISVVAQSITSRFAALQVVLTRTTNAGDADISVDLGIKSYERPMFARNSFAGYRV